MELIDFPFLGLFAVVVLENPAPSLPNPIEYDRLDGGEEDPLYQKKE